MEIWDLRAEGLDIFRPGRQSRAPGHLLPSQPWGPPGKALGLQRAQTSLLQGSHPQIQLGEGGRPVDQGAGLLGLVDDVCQGQPVGRQDPAVPGGGGNTSESNRPPTRRSAKAPSPSASTSPRPTGASPCLGGQR